MTSACFLHRRFCDSAEITVCIFSVCQLEMRQDLGSSARKSCAPAAPSSASLRSGFNLLIAGSPSCRWPPWIAHRRACLAWACVCMCPITSSTLCDGFDQTWPASEVAEQVASALDRFDCTKLVTFDEHGVSGHPNHRAVHRGVLHGFDTQRISSAKVAAYVLESVSLLRKYSGPLDVIFSALASRVCFSDSVQVTQARQALRTHGSQMVWFRHLYLWTSRYMYMNTLRKL
eukprot:m.50367 g.50367  ORF g.50367 m.50367 type:complete len:231 (-) comp6539_c0_seq4:122-814(-)